MLSHNEVITYEQQVRERFDGSYPYRQLAVYYRKQKDYDNEIRILSVALDVFLNDVSPLRSDRMPKIEEFTTRLGKAKELRNKAK